MLMSTFYTENPVAKKMTGTQSKDVRQVYQKKTKSQGLWDRTGISNLESRMETKIEAKNDRTPLYGYQLPKNGPYFYQDIYK